MGLNKIWTKGCVRQPRQKRGRNISSRCTPTQVGLAGGNLPTIKWTARVAALRWNTKSNKFVLRRTNHAAMLFYGGLITLPLVTSVYAKGINDMRGQAHTIETRLRLGVTQTAQSHRPQIQ